MADPNEPEHGQPTSDHPPESELTGAGSGDPTVTSSGTNRRVMVAVAAVLLVAIVAAVVVMRGSDEPSEQDISSAGFTTCAFFTREEAARDRALELRESDEHTDQALLLAFCGVHVRRLDGGWRFSYAPEDDMSEAGYFALTTVLKETGCMTDLDIEKLEETRPIDGRVASADGRTSWTYSTSSGVSVLCER